MAGKEVLMNTSSVFKPTPTVQTDEPEKGKDLHEGGRVELTGLSSEDLNGQRGTINDRYIPDRKRWPLVVDKTRRKLSCKPANLMVLASCGQCGAEKAVEELKKCSKCHAVHYCNDECQRTHWKRGGHKEACKEPLKCTICLEDSEHPLPIQSGCGCRGATGSAHVACKVQHARHMKPDGGQSSGASFHDGWQNCPTCKQMYTGEMKMGMAEGLWSHYANAAVADDVDGRLCAQGLVASALLMKGQLPKAETILREIFETRKKWNGEDSPTTLAIAGNLGNALVNQDKQKEAEVVFRDALERMQRVLGPEHAHSLLTAKNLGQALMNQAKYRQAEPVLRETFAHLRRVFGDSHLASLEACSSLATLLVNTNRPREATEMCRGGLAQSTRTLGPEHPKTLSMASLLAVVLAKRGGHAAEAEELYNTTISAQQRIVGFNHPETQETMQHWRMVQENIKCFPPQDTPDVDYLLEQEKTDNFFEQINADLASKKTLEESLQNLDI